MLKLKELRLEKNLTQKELAEKINSTSKSIWTYENSVAYPPVDVLIRIADFFECSIDYLVGREDDFGNYTEKNKSPILTADETKLVLTYRKLSKHRQLNLLDTASGFSLLEKNK